MHCHAILDTTSTTYTRQQARCIEKERKEDNERKEKQEDKKEGTKQKQRNAALLQRHSRTRTAQQSASHHTWGFGRSPPSAASGVTALL